MNNYLIGFVFFAVLSTTVHAQDAWKEYIYKENQMAFSMPAAPVESTQFVDTAVGKITIHQYMLDKGGYVLTVGMNVYPDKVLQTPSDKRLAGARDGVANNMKVKVTSEKKITLDGNPGIEFQYESDKYFGTWRIYLVGTAMYQIASINSVGTPRFPDTDRFLNSFRLVKP